MKEMMTLTKSNSLRIATIVVFATAAIITLAAYQKHQPYQDIPIDTLSRLRLGRDNLDKDTSSKSKQAKYNDLLTRAAEVARLSLNSQRLAQCPDLPAYSQLTRLNHAKTSTTARGIEKYVLELTFDEGAVISAIAHRLANATDMSADTNEQFVLMSSVPGPCDRHAADQLAISYAGLIVHALLEIGSFDSPCS
jgi:hypothetical protein